MAGKRGRECAVHNRHGEQHLRLVASYMLLPALLAAVVILAPATGFAAVAPDTIPPVTTDNAPAGWQNADFTVTLTCNDYGGSGCANTYYQIDGGGYVVGNSVLISTEGTHTIEYYSLDNAGNAENVKSVTVGLDKTAPLTNDDAPTGWLPLTDGGGSAEDGEWSFAPGGLETGGWQNGPVTVTLTCNDSWWAGYSGCDWTSYEVDGGPTGFGNSVTISGDGVHTLTYRSVDVAGNIEGTKTATVKIDTVPPVTTDDAPEGWQTAPVTVTFTCSDATSGCSLTNYWVDGGGRYTGWSVEVSGDGVHTITYHSSDLAVNVEDIKTATVQIDSTAPSIVNIPPTGIIDSSVIVSADYSDATSGLNLDTVYVTVDSEVDGSSVVDCSVGATGVSCTVSGISAGPHTIEVSVTDNAGNTATATSSFTFCQSGEPALSLGLQSVFWASYADYLDRKLSISFAVNNTGSISAYNVELTGTSATSGVTLATPVPVAVGGIGTGGSGSATLKYNVPAGVTSFTVSVAASAEDQCAEVYTYP